MKKILFLLLLPALLFAQTKQVVFDYALRYVLSPNESAKEYVIYINSNDNNSLLISSKDETYLVDGNSSYYGKLVDGLLKVDYKKEIKDSKFYFLDSLVSTEKINLVNDFKSREYSSKLFTGDNNAIYEVIFDMTDSPIESSHYLKNTPIFSYVKINIDIPEGLPSKITIKNGDQYRVELAKLRRVEKLDKIIYYDVPVIDEISEIELEEIIEELIPIEENVYSYNSDYKENAFSKNYAVKNIIKDRKDRRLLNKVPKYCNNLDIPVLSDKKIMLVLEDYVLQLCDMYLYQSNDKITSLQVDSKLTLDAIRFDINYLIEAKSRLNKKEQKTLDVFLNNLD